MKLPAATFACCCVLGATMSLEASAADAPKRKFGLWEMKTEMAGMPAGMPGGSAMQICIDQSNDGITDDPGGPAGKSSCPVMKVTPGVGKMTIHSVCKDEGTTITTDAVITGDFESNYKSNMTVTYSPPRDGMSTIKLTQQARRLGPCKAGQKQGDVMIPGMPAINAGNAQEMMKDPRIQELMKQYQAK